MHLNLQAIPIQQYLLLELFPSFALRADVNIVYTVSIIRVLYSGSRHSGLGHGVYVDVPVVGFVVKVTEAIVRDTVTDAHEDAVGLEDTCDLGERLSRIGCGPFPTQHRVKGTFVQHNIERLVRKLQCRAVHLLPSEPSFVAVLLHHLVDAHLGDVDVGHCRVAVVVHILTETRVAAAKHEDVVRLAHVLSDEILDAGVTLVPVERLRVSVEVEDIEGRGGEI